MPVLSTSHAKRHLGAFLSANNVPVVAENDATTNMVLEQTLRRFDTRPAHKKLFPSTVQLLYILVLSGIATRVNMAAMDLSTPNVNAEPPTIGAGRVGEETVTDQQVDVSDVPHDGRASDTDCVNRCGGTVDKETATSECVEVMDHEPTTATTGTGSHRGEGSECAGAADATLDSTRDLNHGTGKVGASDVPHDGRASGTGCVNCCGGSVDKETATSECVETWGGAP